MVSDKHQASAWDSDFPGNGQKLNGIISKPSFLITFKNLTLSIAKLLILEICRHLSHLNFVLSSLAYRGASVVQRYILGWRNQKLSLLASRFSRDKIQDIYLSTGSELKT